MTAIGLAIWLLALAWPAVLHHVARASASDEWLDPFERDDPRAPIHFDPRARA